MSAIFKILTIIMALRDLLIRKGVFTRQEYNDAVAGATGKIDQMEAGAIQDLDNDERRAA